MFIALHQNWPSMVMLGGFLQRKDVGTIWFGTGIDSSIWTIHDYVKRCFLWDHNICANNLSAEVKDIMNKLGLTRNFDQLQCCDVNRCKAHLLDIYSSDWSRKTQSVPKWRTYVTFKDSYNVEKYVLLNLSRTERSLLAQFRCGILPLRVETGR